LGKFLSEISLLVNKVAKMKLSGCVIRPDEAIQIHYTWKTVREIQILNMAILDLSKIKER